AAHRGVHRAVALRVRLRHVQEVGVSEQRAVTDDDPARTPPRRTGLLDPLARLVEGVAFLLFQELARRDQADPLRGGPRLQIEGVTLLQEVPITSREFELGAQGGDRRLVAVAEGEGHRSSLESLFQRADRFRKIAVQGATYFLMACARPGPPGGGTGAGADGRRVEVTF